MSTSLHHAGQVSPKEPNPFAAGQKAYKPTANPHKLNPYRLHSREWVRWNSGWQAAQLADVNSRDLPAWAKENAA